MEKAKERSFRWSASEIENLTNENKQLDSVGDHKVAGTDTTKSVDTSEADMHGCKDDGKTGEAFGNDARLQFEDTYEDITLDNR